MKIVLSVLGLCLSLNSFTQDHVKHNKFEFGFNLGVNRTNLVLREEPTVLPSLVSNKFGFDLGVLMNYYLSNRITVSPQAEVSFNNASVTHYGVATQLIMPTSLAFKTHFHFKLNEKPVSLYLVLGPSLRLDIKNDLNAPKSPKSLAIDFGFGLDNRLKNFTIAPEFVYSFGLLDVNPLVASTYYHKISLILNFKD